MRRFCAVVLLILPLSGCHLLGMTGRDRPELIVRGRPMRAVMINPTPPLYGDGNPGGCLILSEFRVEITDVVMEGASALRIRGFVHSSDGRSVPGVQIASVRGGSTAGVVHSRGANVEFDIAAQLGDSAKLVLSRTFFRTLELDVARLASAARTNPAP